MRQLDTKLRNKELTSDENARASQSSLAVDRHLLATGNGAVDEVDEATDDLVCRVRAIIEIHVHCGESALSWERSR